VCVPTVDQCLENMTTPADLGAARVTVFVSTPSMYTCALPALGDFALTQASEDAEVVNVARDPARVEYLVAPP